MQKNIKVNYKELLANSSEFEQTIQQCVEAIPGYTNVCQDSLYYTSEEYLNSIVDTDVDVSKYKNLTHFSPSRNLSLIRFLAELYPGHSIVPTGHFLYPVTGYMSWHTNSNMPGKRIYITYVDEVGLSGFKYLCNGSIVDTIDSEKIVFREFEVDAGNPFWHAVYSNCNRYSFGFRVIDLR